jgi:endonuclease/exonuclease/phosphatase family metal-dependent hydrolase
VRVLTWNLYLGASLDPITGARSVEELPERVDEVWSAARASEPLHRMAAVAAAIEAEQPDAVAVQEAARWSVDGAVAFDFLALLLERLPGYRVAAEVATFGGALPGARSGVVGFEDRGAILVADGARVADARGARFATLARLPVASLELEVGRGWTGATVNGVRILAAHLELAHVPPLATVQREQARELASLASGEGPLVLLGDLNSRPGAAAHARLVAAGLADAWGEVERRPGHTCCQARDLSNDRSLLHERIDHVLVRGMRPRAARVLTARTPGGLWASDHAGLCVDLDP